MFSTSTHTHIMVSNANCIDLNFAFQNHTLWLVIKNSAKRRYDIKSKCIEVYEPREIISFYASISTPMERERERENEKKFSVPVAKLCLMRISNQYKITHSVQMYAWITVTHKEWNAVTQSKLSKRKELDKER